MMSSLFDADTLYLMRLMKMNNNKIKFIEKKYDGKLFYINIYREGFHYSIYFLPGIEKFPYLKLNKKYTIKEIWYNGN